MEASALFPNVGRPAENRRAVWTHFNNFFFFFQRGCHEDSPPKCHFRARSLRNLTVEGRAHKTHQTESFNTRTKPDCSPGDMRTSQVSVQTALERRVVSSPGRRVCMPAHPAIRPLRRLDACGRCTWLALLSYAVVTARHASRFRGRFVTPRAVFNIASCTPVPGAFPLALTSGRPHADTAARARLWPRKGRTATVL